MEGVENACGKPCLLFQAIFWTFAMPASWSGPLLNLTSDPFAWLLPHTWYYHVVRTRTLSPFTTTQ